MAEAKKRGTKLGINGSKLALVNKQLADEFVGSINDLVCSIGIEKPYSEIARKLSKECGHGPVECFKPNPSKMLFYG